MATRQYVFVVLNKGVSSYLEYKEDGTALFEPENGSRATIFRLDKNAARLICKLLSEDREQAVHFMEVKSF
ncbi:MAG: hypothetical protein Q4E34_05960 [Synergistaceae bacterium]|nr:hypothetical protein [Synergistaceae bacterium]